jgi:hypothetical protein
MHFIWQEREKKGKKMIIDNNLTTIGHHVQYYVEDDTLAHLRRWQKVKFSHWVAFNTPSKWRMPSTCQKLFQLKKVKSQRKNTKTPL